MESRRQQTPNKESIDVSGLSEDEVRAVELYVAQLRHQVSSGRSQSVFDLFGKASRLRTARDIDQQVAEERAGWGGR
jgi:hypothetical protein